VGLRIVAAGTHPFAHWSEQDLTPYERYYKLFDTYQYLVREQMIFGCHIHVGLPDPALGIPVLNRIRPWLAPLLALSASSPFWMGTDTAYASYRAQHWSRWPLAGPPPHIASPEEYHTLVEQLIATETIEDPTKLYWDARIHPRYDTLEFRLMDSCPTIETVMMLAGLVRALVLTCTRNAEANTPYLIAHSTLLRVAHWCAARFGLQGPLIDIITGARVPANQVIARLLEFIQPALHDLGDQHTPTLVEHVLRYGTAADHQRDVYRHTGHLTDVVAFLADETERV
jgi:carboxylate-amine ligase